jgi:hypothetical protein
MTGIPYCAAGPALGAAPDCTGGPIRFAPLLSNRRTRPACLPDAFFYSSVSTQPS